MRLELTADKKISRLVSCSPGSRWRLLPLMKIQVCSFFSILIGYLFLFSAISCHVYLYYLLKCISKPSSSCYFPDNYNESNSGNMFLFSSFYMSKLGKIDESDGFLYGVHFHVSSFFFDFDSIFWVVFKSQLFSVMCLWFSTCLSTVQLSGKFIMGRLMTSVEKLFLGFSSIRRSHYASVTLFLHFLIRLATNFGVTMPFRSAVALRQSIRYTWNDNSQFFPWKSDCCCCLLGRKAVFFLSSDLQKSFSNAFPIFRGIVSSPTGSLSFFAVSSENNMPHGTLAAILLLFWHWKGKGSQPIFDTILFPQISLSSSFVF